MNGSEHPPNTVINCLTSIIRLRPKAAAASSASALCTVCTRKAGKFMNIYFQKNENIDAPWVFVLHWAAFSPLYNIL